MINNGLVKLYNGNDNERPLTIQNEIYAKSDRFIFHLKCEIHHGQAK